MISIFIINEILYFEYKLGCSIFLIIQGEGEGVTFSELKEFIPRKKLLILMDTAGKKM